MSQPRALAAFSDCEEYFERALNSPNGIAVTLDTAGLAVQFKAKMNTYRERLRKQSRQVYEPTDPQYGVSPYDKFKLTTDQTNDCRVLIRPYNIAVKSVEELAPED